MQKNVSGMVAFGGCSWQKGTQWGRREYLSLCLGLSVALLSVNNSMEVAYTSSGTLEKGGGCWKPI